MKIALFLFASISVSLAQISCPSGWSPFNLVGLCYKYYPGYRTYDEAQRLCRRARVGFLQNLTGHLIQLILLNRDPLLRPKILEETTSFHMRSPTITFGWEASITGEVFGNGMMAPPSPSTDGTPGSQPPSEEQEINV